jgi:hypothetical protein
LADYWQKTVDKTVEKWRFAEVDYSSASNNFSGWYDAPNYPNWGAFAALQADGSITAWGSSSLGGTNPPSDSDYTKIYSTGRGCPCASITRITPRRD